MTTATSPTPARDFGDIKRLTIAALLAAETSAQHVESFTGQIEDVIEGRTARLPLLAVLFSGNDFTPIDGPSHQVENELSVGIFAHSLAGGAALDDQAEQLIRETLDCLVNARLAVNLEPLLPLRVRLVMGSSTVQIYEFAFSVALDQRFQWPE